jgi:hypothetical protein
MKTQRSELTAEKALNHVEIDKFEIYREQIQNTKDQVKAL